MSVDEAERLLAQLPTMDDDEMYRLYEYVRDQKREFLDLWEPRTTDPTATPAWRAMDRLEEAIYQRHMEQT